MEENLDFDKLLKKGSEGLAGALLLAVEFAPIFAAVIEIEEYFPRVLLNRTLLFAKHGWFLDLGMTEPEMQEVEKRFGAGEISRANDFLVRHFRARSSEILEELKKEYARRAKILEAAFKAHDHAQYELSVPVFIIQADGICSESIDRELFRKNNNVRRHLDKLEQDKLGRALVKTLAEELPINASIDRKIITAELNRNQILHGESVDYASEINSLKALSFLNFVAGALECSRPR